MWCLCTSQNWQNPSNPRQDWLFFFIFNFMCRLVVDFLETLCCLGDLFECYFCVLVRSSSSPKSTISLPQKLDFSSSNAHGVVVVDSWQLMSSGFHNSFGQQVRTWQLMSSGFRNSFGQQVRTEQVCTTRFLLKCTYLLYSCHVENIFVSYIYFENLNILKFSGNYIISVEAAKVIKDIKVIKIFSHILINFLSCSNGKTYL